MHCMRRDIARITGDVDLGIAVPNWRASDAIKTLLLFNRPHFQYPGSCMELFKALPP
jgi:predicted nucleotidyltransferase